MTAYQEDLVSLDELRSRMPDLRQREQAAHAELQSITTQAQDRASYLRLAERRSRRFSAAYAPRPRHLTSWNVNGSSDYWSRRYWSLTTRSLSGIRSPLRPTPLITTSRRNPPSLGHQNTQVIFCVQGVITPPLWGAFRPLKEATVRSLDRGTQPPTNVETLTRVHPWRVRFTAQLDSRGSSQLSRHSVRHGWHLDYPS